MAQHSTLSKITFPSRRLSTSSMSSVGSRPGQVLEAPAASVEFSNPFEKTTPHRPNATKVDKRNGNVMKTSYNRVKKSTSSMFQVKSRRSSGNTSTSSLSDREQPMSLTELDARLQMLERAGHPPMNSHPFTSLRKTSLTPHLTTPRREGTPCLWQVPEQDDEFTHSEVQHPRPNPLGRKNSMDRSLLFLVAALIAIPNVALSSVPMTVTIIVGSAIAVLYGYRLAVVFPVLMLLNPASPIWRETDARMKSKDVLVFAPKQSHISSHPEHYSRQASPQLKPIAPSRRHSTF